MQLSTGSCKALIELHYTLLQYFARLPLKVLQSTLTHSATLDIEPHYTLLQYYARFHWKILHYTAQYFIALCNCWQGLQRAVPSKLHLSQSASRQRLFFKIEKKLSLQHSLPLSEEFVAPRFELWKGLSAARSKTNKPFLGMDKGYSGPALKIYHLRLTRCQNQELKTVILAATIRQDKNVSALNWVLLLKAKRRTR